MSASGQRHLTAAALAALLVVAVGVRSLRAGDVYDGSETVLVGDADPHYHVRQAERILKDDPQAPWFDPALDWPNGALVPWPPLFDALVAGLARALHGELATTDEIAAVAAALPPVLGALSVLLVVALAGALLGRGPWLLAGLLLAFLPAHAQVTTVGRADQHALEQVLAPALWLAFVLAWRATGRRRAAATALLAVATAAAFWTWPGSGFLLAVPAVGVAALHLRRDADAAGAARALAWGAGGGALLLLASIALWGAPGALGRASVAGLNALHVAVAAGCATFGGVLAAVGRWRRWPDHGGARALEVAAALALPALATLGLSGTLREGAARGLAALAASGPWYSTIAEFDPLVGSLERPLGTELLRALELYGLLPPAALVAYPQLRRRWAERTEDRSPLTVLGAWLLLLGLAALARVRFTPYAALVLVVPGALGIVAAGEAIAERLARRAWAGAWAAVLTGLALAPGFPRLVAPANRISIQLDDTLRFLRAQPPRPDGRDGVAADWDVGHAVLLVARKPVLASPFGTEAGPRSLADSAELAYAVDGDQAEAILARRRIGYVIVSDPLVSAVKLAGFAPPASPPIAAVSQSLWARAAWHPLPGINRLVLTRLQLIDGAASPDGDAFLAGFRLLYEASAAEGVPLKVFGVVAGARLRVEGARPGSLITARVALVTNAARQLELVSSSPADDRGRAVLRVPYASGANGATTAGEVLVSDGARRARVQLGEQAVLLGGEVEAVLRTDGE